MHVIDSHTGGMPTRLILEGAPELGAGSLKERAGVLARDHWGFCEAVLREPRGQPGMVAALLLPPDDPQSAAGVIYFDREAVLGMCGHGTIGLAVSLADLGRIAPGLHRIDTPAGTVAVELQDANTVSVTNIESRRIRRAVTVEVAGHGPLTGDLAYGGNWFFIAESPLPVQHANIPALTALSIAVREACHRAGLNGPKGEPVDHVILSGQSSDPQVHRRNFVLCPDDEYDRSPCGTGSSAFVACMAEEGTLAPGQEIILESAIGSRYRISYQSGPGGGVMPTLTGQAHVMAESRLLFAPDDPFRGGIGAGQGG
ncbi:proline racemase family protein [Pseudoruegeria sp. SHC-113]|uniref:4-hydroxyproline epimerase n=1 Tax=Pseudoruegeria sp. SHC-113 TaxID=2855439 RepID=UPI0021BA6BDA|nr:proline racemase family protein [Pseudoruegeria sp. SHC-113]MCT8162082.1 proline racemase family protein [Pseudoruegeria sp. SHC-113]